MNWLQRIRDHFDPKYDITLVTGRKARISVSEVEKKFKTYISKFQNFGKGKFIGPLEWTDSCRYRIKWDLQTMECHVEDIDFDGCMVNDESATLNIQFYLEKGEILFRIKRKKEPQYRNRF